MPPLHVINGNSNGNSKINGNGESNKDDLVAVAEGILKHTQELAAYLTEHSIAAPRLEAGARTELWTTHTGPVEASRTALTGLMQHLEKLVHGPHGFLHEYVSGNWEYGALNTLFEFDVLEKIPLAGTASADELAEKTSLPAEKLLRICRLVACTGILKETEAGIFAHTAVSEELVSDAGFRAWVGFQLYETRVASAHLADSLRRPNPFWKGQAAFEYAWGMPMYDWHRKHPEKGKRFAQAMESVSKGLDPGNGMIIDWFTSRSDIHQDETALVVDVAGKTGSFAVDLAGIFPKVAFEVQDEAAALLKRGEASLPAELSGRITFRERSLLGPRTLDESSTVPCVLLLRSALWCLDDETCIGLLRSFIPLLQHAQRPTLLINDLVSPAWGTFEPHVERAFRRRDVTVMTMHNAKQRTAGEWAAVLRAASPAFHVEYTEAYSSHSCRGLWQVQMASGEDTS
ncbi:putative O-methyltransferase [Lasiosphaeria ovina]|uniref:O-methyltransferase n=1 Tax=Lasiosphaeria ovina TaxID=92902 RepID=A0AAE0K4F8_9PEZI|nr:putative O-methyltransferase [Lasiosphaeria ovina]